MPVAAPLDPTIRGPESRVFENLLAQKIVGQHEAIAAVADLFQLYEAGLAAPGRPVGNLLFLGPTGSGKTRVVEAAAEILFGDSRAVIKVDCAEFQHSHEIAKLVGSPPGYLGHRETHPLITQEALARYHTERVKLSLLLFDEIEKASDALWQLLLGILDKATLTLGDNRRVDLSDSLIFLTSNLGSAEIDGMIQKRLGFAPRNEATSVLDRKIESAAVEAARRKFSPEFMNRIDKVVVFRPLLPEQLERILDLELGVVQHRLLQTARTRCTFHLDSQARGFLLREGTDLRYGARHLKRAIDRHLVCPLANLIASEQVAQSDLVSVEYDERGGRLAFAREPGKPLMRRSASDGEAATLFAASLAGFPVAAAPAAASCAPRDRRSLPESTRARRRDR
ncbi:MAG: ATP-dependent Clp protease ATP-binding subunit [Acidobacteriota bacterium]|nr:ATP-dependent Clp protease ATP-binding subunit [Acidobacteriota bacterium]